MMAQLTKTATPGIAFPQTLHAAWTKSSLPTGWMEGCWWPAAFHPVEMVQSILRVVTMGMRFLV